MLNTNFQRLQRVQNSAARIVCQALRRQHHSADFRKDVERSDNTWSAPGNCTVVVINMLTYASLAWWGFAAADDRNRLETFIRKSAKPGSTTFASICADVHCKLFARITQHLRMNTSTPSLFVNAVTPFNFLIVYINQQRKKENFIIYKNTI